MTTTTSTTANGDDSARARADLPTRDRARPQTRPVQADRQQQQQQQQSGTCQWKWKSPYRMRVWRVRRVRLLATGCRRRRRCCCCCCHGRVYGSPEITLANRRWNVVLQAMHTQNVRGVSSVRVRSARVRVCVSHARRCLRFCRADLSTKPTCILCMGQTDNNAFHCVQASACA